MRKLPLAALAALTLLVAGSTHAEIDLKNFDLSAKPQDDFYQYANGGWIKANPVPPAYSSWGAGRVLAEKNRDALHAILDRVAQAEKPTAIEKLVGDFFASGMDEAAIDAAGLTPLQPEFDRIAALKSPADLPAALAHLHLYGVRASFFLTSEQDPKDTTMMITGGGQGGLGLPDRDYYFRDDEKSKKIRAAYVAHVAKTLELAGAAPADAATGADAIMALETALAKGSKKKTELRDPVANYHKLPAAEVQKLTPHFDWPAYFAGLGIAAPASIDIAQPEFFSAFDAAIAGTDLAIWKTYLRWNLLRATSPVLSTPFAEEHFAFFDKTLTGAQQMRERWKRVLDVIDGEAGEALGQLYVAEYFPPESKARMVKLVANLRAALRERISTLEWMDEPTRAKALAKLAAFGVKVGYPDQWIDYSPLTIDRGAYVANFLRARAFNNRRELAKIGQPVDRGEWGMTPPTVNAYYNPTMNEIVFPAGILQPPYFDGQADDAINYGGIGGVIGHEMTHGFDDEGRQYAADGTLTDWWTPESAKLFNARAAGIVKQFNGYVAIDDLHINGELTQGENIADLGGIKIAYAALQKALAGQSRAKIGGFTPEQRFFLGWASGWRNNTRPEAMRLRVQTDPHSPAKFRVNGPFSNLDEFHEAFAVPEGAPMRRTAADRVVIW
jgi:predicted metalloendopeptidase